MVWNPPPQEPSPLRDSAQLVLVFGAPHHFTDAGVVSALRDRYPRAAFAGASTAGQILDEGVHDDAPVSVAIAFEGTSVRVHHVDLTKHEDQADTGARLGRALDAPDLNHVLLFSDGTRVNGSHFLRGLLGELAWGVGITGGLAGDGERFEKTWVLTDEGPATGRVVAVALHGQRLRAGFGSVGGWRPHGPLRKLTRSEGNVVHEIDGEPALEVYRRILGPAAAQLPSSGLSSPLMILDSPREYVRTLIGIDEKTNSLVFAGDMPEGKGARFMRATHDSLVQRAGLAARDAVRAGEATPHLALLVSCVGRRLLMGARTPDELRAVREVLGPATPLVGFYSYGEIAPAAGNPLCTIHNQTMTLTTLYEQ